MNQPAPVQAPVGSTIPASALLQERIDALRRRQVTVAVMTGLAALVVVSLELLTLAMFLDWWLELPWAVRLVSLIAQIGVFAWILLRMIISPLVRQPDDDELALMVEKARPEFRSRLIAALQLTRPNAIPPGASPALVTALVEETERLARPADFRRIVSTARMKKLGVLAVVIPLFALASFTRTRATSIELLKRVFLSNVPVPRKTRIVVAEGDRIVGRGDTVRLEALVEGVVPARGKVWVQYRSRRAQEFPLEQNLENVRQFLRSLENVQDNFSYRFHLGDGVSATYNVKAIPRPTILTIECQQEFPAYTGLKTASRSLGDLALLAGSVLKIKATATKELQSAQIRLVGVESNLALRVSETNKHELTGQFTVPAKGMSGFQIQMLDTENMDSRDSAVYRVDILPDKVPQVRLTYPDRKEELLTRAATMLLGFEASDDFEIARVRLKFKTSADTAAEAVELDLQEQNPKRLRRRYEWKLADYISGLSEGSAIEYWIEVEDNNNVTGPGIGATDHQLIKVVSEAEKRADLLNRAGDYLGSITDVVNDQEKLNRNLGLIIKAKTGF